MKLRLFLIMGLLSSIVFAMEGPETSSLGQMPPEIKSHIFSLVTESNSLDAAIKNLQNLALVNKEFYQILNDDFVAHQITEELYKRFSNDISVELANRINRANTFDQAIQNLASWGNINREYQRLLNSDLLTEQVVIELTRKFPWDTKNNPIIAALLLGTPAAQQWLSKNFEKVKAFINSRASVYLTDQMLAFLLKNPKFAQYYIRDYVTPWGNPGLIELISTGKIALLKQLLDSNLDYDINIVDELRNTPLIVAIKNENFDLVEYLLQKGADPNQGDKLETTPLMHAALKGNRAIVQKLLEAGANPLARNALTGTAREFAQGREFNEIAQLLEKAEKAAQQ